MLAPQGLTHVVQHEGLLVKVDVRADGSALAGHVDTTLLAGVADRVGLHGRCLC